MLVATAVHVNSDPTAEGAWFAMIGVAAMAAAQRQRGVAIMIHDELAIPIFRLAKEPEFVKGLGLALGLRDRRILDDHVHNGFDGVSMESMRTSKAR